MARDFGGHHLPPFSSHLTLNKLTTHHPSLPYLPSCILLANLTPSILSFYGVFHYPHFWICLCDSTDHPGDRRRAVVLPQRPSALTSVKGLRVYHSHYLIISWYAERQGQDSCITISTIEGFTPRSQEPYTILFGSMNYTSEFTEPIQQISTVGYSGAACTSPGFGRDARFPTSVTYPPGPDISSLLHESQPYSRELDHRASNMGIISIKLFHG